MRYFLERQMYLVKNFDNKYGLSISPVLSQALNDIEDYSFGRRPSYAMLSLEKDIEDSVPDTDDYGEIEGTFAQKGLIDPESSSQAKQLIMSTSTHE